MADFNDFKEKAGAFFSQAAQTTKELATAAADKARKVSRIAKLNMDIVSQKETIKKAYAELGQLYYENHHDAPEGLLSQSCQEIDVAKAAIADMEAEIAQLKSSEDTEQVQDGDFETVVDATAAQADIEVEITVEADDDEEEDLTVIIEQSDLDDCAEDEDDGMEIEIEISDSSLESAE